MKSNRTFLAPRPLRAVIDIGRGCVATVLLASVCAGLVVLADRPPAGADAAARTRPGPLPLARPTEPAVVASAAR